MHQTDESLESTVRLIRSQLPEFDEITKIIRKAGGHLCFAEQIIQLLVLDGLPPWSSFYTDPIKLKSLVTRLLIGDKKLVEFSNKLTALSSEDQLNVKECFKSQILDSNIIDVGFDKIEIPSEADFDLWLEEAVNQESSEHSSSLYLLLYTALTQVYFYFAVMTFGRSMCDLVRAAQAGDETAFFAAVRIDKTVLFGIPYFQKRLIRAQVGNEPDFFQKLSNAVRGGSLGFKLSHRRLMFVFAILDDEGFLDLPLEQLLDICIEVGITDVPDTEILRKRRKYYREQTGRQIAF
jgi:hypothetical protein